MIINTFDNKIKILLDNNDLKNIGIKSETILSNSNNAITTINNFLNLNINNESILNDYFIYTYNYKIYLITILIK